MRFVREASFDEYATWFFERARRTKACETIPETAHKRLDAFQTWARGKFHDWFITARWTVQLVESPRELESLMVVSAPFTREYRLWNDGEQRLLGVEARNALQHDYFLNDPTSGRHARYYLLLKGGKLKLEGQDRLVLITLDESSRLEAPAATYYLHDGFGRALPYMMLLEENGLQFEPMEAILAERV